MNGKLWKILAITAATVITISMLPDIKRYIRISSM
jgi:hypothetical protein